MRRHGCLSVAAGCSQGICRGRLLSFAVFMVRGVCFLGEKVGDVGNRGYLCGYLWPDEVRAEAE